MYIIIILDDNASYLFILLFLKYLEIVYLVLYLQKNHHTGGAYLWFYNYIPFLSFRDPALFRPCRDPSLSTRIFLIY